MEKFESCNNKLSQYKKIIIRLIDALDKHEFEIFGELYTPFTIYHQLTENTRINREKFKTEILSLYDSFPDMKHSITEIINEGNKTVILFTLEGTHKNVFRGNLPKGKKFKIQCFSIFKIDVGRITEQWFIINYHQLTSQLS